MNHIGLIEAMGRPKRSALLDAGRKGGAKITAVFGGQGPSNSNCLVELAELEQAHRSTLAPLIELAATILAESATQPDVRSFFQDDTGFDLSNWLRDPSSAPDRDFLAQAPVSFPINTLISLCNYAVVVHTLGLEPGAFRSALQSVTGHSQGIFAAAAVSAASSWESFLDAAALVVQLSFLVGLESHYAAPPSVVAAAAFQDCLDHGEGRPSHMLGITGMSRLEVDALIQKLNERVSQPDTVYLALANTRQKHVIAGPPQSLRIACTQLRELGVTAGADQSRILFNKRKPRINAQFLPISAPFHGFHLDGVAFRVAQTMDQLSLTLKGDDLGLPLIHPRTGQDMKVHRHESIIGSLVSSVTTDTVEWPSICAGLDSTHIIGFGPGNIGALIHEVVEGTGVCVLQLNGRHSASKTVLGAAELYSERMPPAAADWAKSFAPRIELDCTGKLAVRTKATELFKTPPLIVAGMTPTTVPWQFVSCITQAGYHVELAGGGYFSEERFEAAIRALAKDIPIGRGITCNILYASPTTVAWQISLLRRLIREGFPIDGITIGAGIPSPDIVGEYIETMGLTHISFKPGSLMAIESVIEIAQKYPDFPIGLQWTGGRAGGHHSWEDFHDPIIESYARIRRCENIVLIAGSGFGGKTDSWPYLSGQWAKDFGCAPMPFDAILLGSRLMVAKEAHTSTQAKQLIVDVKGVRDADWHDSFDKPTGGVVTITSEMGQPIHMIATRGVLLWKELDQRVFSIRDPVQRLEYLQDNREEIIDRLNRDFQRPWFCVDSDGESVDLEDMTYMEVLQRLCELMYVQSEQRWIDVSWQKLIQDYLNLWAERFGDHTTYGPHTTALQFQRHLKKALGSHVDQVLYPEDVQRVLCLFRRRGQKPVPFIPALDEHFETWFKKDSLWQSEDVNAVVGRDAQRCCIIQGPVAAAHSTSCEESAKQILDGICDEYIRELSSLRRDSALPKTQEKLATSKQLANVDVETHSAKVVYTVVGSPGTLVNTRLILEQIVNTFEQSWVQHCLDDDWIYKDHCRIRNPMRSAFIHDARPGETIVVRLNGDRSAEEIELNLLSSDKTGLRTAFSILSRDGRIIEASLKSPRLTTLDLGLSIRYEFALSTLAWSSVLVDITPQRFESVRGLYTQLWLAGSNDRRPMGLSSSFSDRPTVLTRHDVEAYMATITPTTPAELRAWDPRGAIPLDYCIVVAWAGLVKPLMVPALQIDLLNLLHRSISFKYVFGEKRLQIGDILQTTSRITAVVIQPAGKLVEVRANILRAGKVVVEIKTNFFVRGHFDDWDTQFRSAELSPVEVDVSSDRVRSILRSRRWLSLERADGAPIIGSKLIFRLTTHTTFRKDGKQSSLQVAGDVFASDDARYEIRIGRVYYEEENSVGNPVMDFLDRYKSASKVRHLLDIPGDVAGSTILLKAPSTSHRYAVASRDTNPIHVCPAFARFAGLDSTVVHGMQTSAMVRRVVEWAVGDSDRTLFQGWQVSFEGMVCPNDRIRVLIQHVAMEAGRMIFKVEGFNDDTNEKVLVAEAVIEQTRTGYVFCGQGSQEKGMGMTLYESSVEARAVWDRAEKFLWQRYGFSLLRLVRENPKSITLKFRGKQGKQVRANYLAMTKKGPTGLESCIIQDLHASSSSYTFAYDAGLLYSTQFSQPALVVMEMAEYAHLKARGVVQHGAPFAGHSLGEYAALGACTNLMPFESLLTLVLYRGLKMQNAVQRDADGHTDFSMMAADPSRMHDNIDEEAFNHIVTTIAKRTGLLLEVVNNNIRGQQYVCAGHLQALSILGSVCDSISISRAWNPERLAEMIQRSHDEHSRDPNITLRRGRATIPLSGIDIPFHSQILWDEITHYRDYLLEQIPVGSINPDELDGKWIPNVVGQPFSVDKSYVGLARNITGSRPLQRLLEGMA